MLQGQFDDARTNLAIALTAAREGAVMGNYCNVENLLFSGSGGGGGGGGEDSDTDTDTDTPSRGKVNGALITDTLSGKSFKVRAKSVLLCAGPFTDALRRQADPRCQEAVTGSGGGGCRIHS